MAVVAAAEYPMDKTSGSEQVFGHDDTSNRPWFLSATEIYKLIKGCVSAIPMSQKVFDHSLLLLENVTKYIDSNTSLKVVLTSEQSRILIDEVDSVLSEQLVIVDDGLDDLRAKLTTSLRQLLVAVARHKNWVETLAEEARDSAVVGVQTRYEQVMSMLEALMQAVRDNFPQVVESTTSTLTQTRDKVQNLVAQTTHDTQQRAKELVDTRVLAPVQYALQVAQPYVHQAVVTGAPYVHKALEASQPYVATAKPYVEPWVERATDVTNSLKEHSVLGPYVHGAVHVAQDALDKTKQYVLPPQAPAAPAHEADEQPAVPAEAAVPAQVVQHAETAIPVEEDKEQDDVQEVEPPVANPADNDSAEDEEQ